VKVFFSDPYSPWQRGTNGNTNGRLRQYFPQGTDLSRWSEQGLEAVAITFNNKPGKTLDWRTRAEARNGYLQSSA
jgi:IS30 family transposase